MNTNSAVWRSIKRLHQIYPDKVNDICHRIGLSGSMLLNQNLTLPVDVFLKFFIEAESVFNDELITINYARLAQIRPNYAEAFGLMFVYSRHLKEGFKLLQAYVNIELEGINFAIREESTEVKVIFIANPNIKHGSIYENLCLSILAAFIRSKRFPIRCINTKILTVGSAIKEESVFNCPINSQSSETSIVISKKNYLKKNAISNTQLVDYLKAIAQEKMHKKDGKKNLITNIEVLMSNYENHYSNINIQVISDQLGISTNKFRYQLSKENTTFRKVLNNFKLKKTKNMLQSGLSVKVVSYQLGYSDPSSFVRWFIGQTKLTPTSFKARNKD
ncbi:MAG: AraC-like DNA-binding protein [Brevundimonas sp.]|jgi:AraC-like DNA-binding protein|tara:strand:+ start:1542 stop:2537 length:996 start_codon:yes stop_codon:yes gene_type:complete